MAKAKQTVIKLKVESAILQVSNGNNSESPYDVTAKVRVTDGKIGNIEDGLIYRRENGAHLGNFHQFEHGSQVSFTREVTDSYEKTAVFAASEEFINCAKTGEIENDILKEEVTEVEPSTVEGE